MDVADCYDELGLRPDCSDAEIKAAWRRLAARWHPDRNPSPHALRKIQRINRALEEIRRSREAVPAADSAEEEDPPSSTETHLHQSVQLSVEEAFAGATRELAGEWVATCTPCGGSGRQREAAACPTCGGNGQVRQPLWFGWLATQATCQHCQGTGAVHLACEACAGAGRAQVRKYRCRVKFPAGVRAGAEVHAPARFQPASDGVKATVCARVEIAPHPFFQLEEDGTVRCELPVDGFAWMANRWIEVPTPGGLQQMKLRRDALTYRIKGQGFPTEPFGPRADCIVNVAPVFPEHLSAEQELLFDRLMASQSDARLVKWKASLRAWQRTHP